MDSMVIEDLNQHEASTHSRRDRWHAATAGYLGWTLDAFDFFIVVFMVDTLAHQFQVSKSAIIWTLTATLAMRPVGAIAFGMLADLPRWLNLIRGCWPTV